MHCYLQNPNVGILFTKIDKDSQIAQFYDLYGNFMQQNFYTAFEHVMMSFINQHKDYFLKYDLACSTYQEIFKYLIPMRHGNNLLTIQLWKSAYSDWYTYNLSWINQTGEYESNVSFYRYDSKSLRNTKLERYQKHERIDSPEKCKMLAALHLKCLSEVRAKETRLKSLKSQYNSYFSGYANVYIS